MKFKSIIFSFLCTVLAVHSGLAQSQETLISSADEAFKDQRYQEAAVAYRRALLGPEPGTTNFDFVMPYAAKKGVQGKRSYKITDTDRRTYVQYRLAESYRLYNNYTNAEKQYEAVLNGDSVSANNFPLTRYWYAYCLKANGKYDKAIAEFNEFKAGNISSEYVAMADQQIAKCTMVQNQISSPANYNVVKVEMPNLQGKGSTFSEALFNANTLVFSSPKTELDDESTGEYNKKPHNSLYSVNVQGTRFSNPQELGIKVEGYDHVGTPVYSRDKQNIYFTAWNFRGKITKSAIYMMRYDAKAGGFANPTPLNENVNQSGSLNMHPCLATNDQVLIFSSDRTGGQGKLDLWYANIDANGNAGVAINMGTVVNTENDDETPFYDDIHQLLYFSSRGHGGLGGLDIVKSKGYFEKWGPVQGLSYPVNSSRDDAYFISYDNGKRGFFSSDRNSSCCYELYQFDDISLSVNGTICDELTQKALNGASITVIDSNLNAEIGSVITDSLGNFSFDKLSMDKSYRLLIKKDGYYAKNVTINTFGQQSTDTLKIGRNCLQALVLNQAVELKNIYYDFNSAKLRPESKTTIDETILKMLKANPDLYVELNSHTDSKGSDDYNQKLSNARAQSVVDYLIEKGVLQDHLVARGYGESQPVVPNENADGSDNPANRQLNRRTEFVVRK